MTEIPWKEQPPPRAAVCLGVTRCYISRLLELGYTIKHRHTPRGARYQSPWWLVIALNNLQQSSGLILYHSREIYLRGGKAEDVWWQPSSVRTQGVTIVSSLEVTFEVRAHLHGPFSPQAEGPAGHVQASPSWAECQQQSTHTNKAPPHPSTTPRILVNKKGQRCLAR